MPTVLQMLDQVRDDILDPRVDAQNNAITPRYSTTVLLRKLNLAAQQIARRTLCVKKTQSINTVAGTQQYSLSSDYVQLRTVMYRENLASSFSELIEVPLDETIRGTQNANAVYGFARRADSSIRLVGTPQSSVSSGLVIDYYAIPTEITSGSAPSFDIPERYRDAVIHRTTALMLAGPDEEPGKAADANALYEQSVQECLDREKEASQTKPGRVRDAYDPLGGYWGNRNFGIRF